MVYLDVPLSIFQHQLQEVKYCYQYVDFRIDEDVIHISNNYLFTDLNEYQLQMDMLCNGNVVQTKTMTVDCKQIIIVDMNIIFIYSKIYILITVFDFLHLWSICTVCKNNTVSTEIIITWPFTKVPTIT